MLAHKKTPIFDLLSYHRVHVIDDAKIKADAQDRETHRLKKVKVGKKWCGLSTKRGSHKVGVIDIE